jgi:methyltransferase-like protein/cyclopropane fatty-acyl-phospholipid synthase-like methyltransferase
VGFAYDHVHYPGFPLAQTQPDRLATIAGLFGMTAARPDRCRVLELGCGDGGNLIPMALGLPDSEFTGIDLAEQAIAQGLAISQTLGLENISLRQMDLVDAGADLGQFDYILAHGVYSWVPQHVRECVLRICRANLAPDGVAYVSYNAYPGFHRREIFREMMLHHVRNVQDPASRYQEAVQLIEELAKHTTKSTLARALFKGQVQHLSETVPWAVYHDDLEDNNHAFYFHEFIADARRQQLQYLGEADFYEMQAETYAEPVLETLERFAGTDWVVREQYLDFMKGRSFRQTLLCPDQARLDRSLSPDRITELYVESAARPVSANPDLRDGVAEMFRGPRGAAIETDCATAKAALCRLREIWPRTMHFSELLNGSDAARLADVLLRGYRVGLLDLHTLPSPFAAIAGERPVASPLARLQARYRPVVTTLRHTLVELDDAIDRCVLLLLDGMRNRDALMEGVREFQRSGAVSSDDPLTADSLEVRLGRLAKEALLLR